MSNHLRRTYEHPYTDETLFNFKLRILQTLDERLGSEDTETVRNLDAGLKKKIIDVVDGIEYRYHESDRPLLKCLPLIIGAHLNFI